MAQLLRLTNQTGTVLLMLPTLWALVLASAGKPSLRLVIIFALGSFLMRSAGVVVNDLADRTFDRQVTRTRTRPLATGALTPREAVLVAAVLLLLAAALLLFLNPLAAQLSLVALFLAVLYPFSKRVIHIPQAVLGLAFGWGAVMAWAAVRNSLDPPIWWLYGAVICWAIAYDTIYALQDREDDARLGLKSAALFFGAWTWLAVGVAFALMLLCVGLAGWLVGLAPGFYVILATVGGYLSQQVRLIRRPIDPAQAFRLFRHHVGVGAAILAGIWLGFL
ncbi:MAG: 4-hydroxybenzoate octaprenyltransferase [Nitrospirales bacterium]